MATLSRKQFVRREPKGHLLSLDQCKALIQIITTHQGVMLVPITVNLGFADRKFIETLPSELRVVLEQEGQKCLYDQMRSNVSLLAKQSGNLSPDQLVRLTAYTVGVKKALNAISIFYHCPRFHAMYSPIRMVFDKTGASNSREELVLKQIMFMWIMKWSEREPIWTIKEIHTADHPFIRLYRASSEGKPALDLSKMLRDRLEFRDSKATWQLQIADMLAWIWRSAIEDYQATKGYLPLFRALHVLTVLPNDQPVGLISVAAVSQKVEAPARFDIFRRTIGESGKLLPCGWADP
ncbi:MAG: hypothetical protein LAO04_21200 [Acidobacteriia bacterium]|nr:hypothetical protein [Terriglobia bacterium]